MAKKESGKNVSVTRGKKGISEPSWGRSLSAFEEMERLFDPFFRRGWMRPFSWESPFRGEMAIPFEGRIPNVDVVEREKEIVIRAEIPGVDKDDLEITLDENRLTIKGSTWHEEKEEKEDYVHREISTGSFSRSVSLPAEIDSSTADAKFKDGVLEMTLQKSKPSKRQNIKVS